MSWADEHAPRNRVDHQVQLMEIWRLVGQHCQQPKQCSREQRGLLMVFLGYPGRPLLRILEQLGLMPAILLHLCRILAWLRLGHIHPLTLLLLQPLLRLQLLLRVLLQPQRLTLASLLQLTGQ